MTKSVRHTERALRALDAAAEERIERLRWQVDLLERELTARDHEASPAGSTARREAVADGATRATAQPAAGTDLALRVALADHSRMIADLRASNSWRVTEPMRAIRRLLFGERKATARPAPSTVSAPTLAVVPARQAAPATAPAPVGIVPDGDGRTAAPRGDVGGSVAVLAPVSPQGVTGGAERLYAGLVDSLRAAGCTVELITIPVDEMSFESIQDGYRAFEQLDLSAFDAVISTKAPSYAVFHPNHLVYLVHTVRAFYDMFDDGVPDPRRNTQRAWIQRADTRAIERARARFAIGQEVVGRLTAANGLTATVLHPGLNLEGLHHAAAGDYFFLPGRLHAWKRVDLAIRAVRGSSLPMKLVLAGDGEAEFTLRDLAGGDPRIVFLGRISDDALREHYAACLAVPFTPIREDYGYVTIEAFASAKPVITCSDSGEPARIVEDGINGLVVPPRVEALQQAMERLWQDRPFAERLGASAGMRSAAFTWDNVAGRLLATAFDGNPAPAAKVPLRVAVLDMQPITPAIGGGRVRLLGLYRDLGPGFETRYVGSFDWPGEARRTTRLSPTLTEIVVPLSDAHHAAARAAAQEVGGRVVIDALFGQHAHLSPDYLAAIHEAVHWADVVVFSHPWVAPLVAPERLAGKRIIYDAHNCEGRLKAALFDRGDPAQAAVVDYVIACERALGARADLVLACAETDRATFVADYGWPAEQIRIVANGVSAGDIPLVADEARRSARHDLGIPDDLVVAFFLGSDFAPNVAAARFIADSVAREIPQVLFVIAGGCSAHVTVSAGNCRLAGPLSDDEKAAWMAAADIALNPMASGSGTNVKMFDYMAHGLPVVATPTGARGIAERNREGVIVAAASGFADAVADLARAPLARRRALGHANRAWAARDFDWRIISRQLGQTLREPQSRDGSVADRRVAHLATTGLRCGIGEYARHLIAALKAEGAANLLLAATSDQEVQDLANLPQPALIAWKRDTVDWRYGAILPEALSAIRAWRPDRLIVQYHPSFYARGDIEHLVRSALAAGVATRVVVHRFVDGDAPLLRCLATLGCTLYSHSPSERRRALAHDIALMPLAMPVESPASAASRPPVSGGPHLVANGFMRRHKGFRHLIEAMPAILRGHPDATLTLFAPRYPAPDSEAEAAVCRQRVESLGLTGHVTIDGTFREHGDLLARIGQADLAILPYEDSDEGGSAAAGDCLAAGTPLLVSRAPVFDGVRDSAATTESDATAIAYAVLRLLAEPAALADLKEAADRYRQTHTWGAAARRLAR